MKVVRKELTPAELEPTTIRYNEDCSCIQSLVGDEWVDNPSADPRVSATYQYPPPDTADPACDAGERISAAIERIISTVFDAVSVIEAVSTMIGVVAVFFPPIALFVALLFALISAANAIGFAAVQLSFTDMVYEQIACLVFCNIGADGQFTEDEWNAFQDDVGSTFGLSTVTAILSLMFNAMGMVAFNNMASAGTETGDCSACACNWGYTWAGAEITAGDWSSFTQGALSNFGATGFSLADGAIKHIDFTITWGGDGGGGDSAAAIWVPSATRVLLAAPLGDFPSPATFIWDGVEISPTSIQVGANGAAGSTTTITITEINVEGSGTIPAWVHGHEYTP